MEAAHDHDCEACVFVGGDAPVDGETPVNQVDMWVHLHPRGGASLIRRYSSEGPDYASMEHCPVVESIPRYGRVAAAARTAGLIP